MVERAAIRALFVLGLSACTPDAVTTDGAGGSSSASSGVESTSSSGTMASTSASGTASSSTGGSVCALDCMGGACVDGVCAPERLTDVPIYVGKIAALPDAVVVLVTADGATWAVGTIDKSPPHVSTPFDSGSGFSAIATVGDKEVFWAKAATFHHRVIGDPMVTSFPAPFVTPTGPRELGVLTFGPSDVRLCATYDQVLPYGGVWCMQPDGTGAQHVMDATLAAGLAGDGLLGMTIDSPDTASSSIYAYDGMNAAVLRTNPYPTKDVTTDGKFIYWIDKPGNQIHAAASAAATVVTASAVLGATGVKLRMQDSYVYALTGTGVERFARESLVKDPGFFVALQGVPLDFDVDEEGVYWMAGGATSEVGFLGASSVATN